MLADATRRIARNSETVTLVARDTDSMNSLVAQTPANFVGVDYTDVDAFIARLRDARKGSGDFDLVVAWIHSVGAPALEALKDLFDIQSTESRFIHVIGSSGSDTPVPPLAEVPRVTYQRVLLGHVVRNGQRRWLTHDEISAGVWRAVVSGDPRTVVGRLS